MKAGPFVEPCPGGRRVNKVYIIALAASIHFCMLSTAFGHPGVGDRIHLLNDAIADQPENQYLYVQRSLAHSENGSALEAMQDIQRATNLGDPVNAAFVHGVVLYRESSYRRAQQNFDQYLMAHPEHLESLEYRARLLRDTGQDKAALNDFFRIFSLNPAPNPGLYISASDLMVELPSYGIEAAVSLLDQGMTKLGAVTQLQRRAIALEQQRNNYPAAIRRMHQLPLSLRSTPQWKIELAQFHLLNSDQKGAEALLLSASLQLDSLPRNGIRDAARKELLDIRRQLTPHTTVEQSARKPL